MRRNSTGRRKWHAVWLTPMATNWWFMTPKGWAQPPLPPVPFSKKLMV